MISPRHILVIRFSSMGDVAMTVPVIKQLLDQHPQVRITVVSSYFFQPLFHGLERCNFHPVFLKKQHKGFIGMFRLFRELKKLQPFDAIADLHNVLRSKIIKSFFLFALQQVSTLNKARAEKRELVQREHKVFKQLTSMHQRYASVFNRLRMPVSLNEKKPMFHPQPIPVALQSVFSTGKKVIGIAPFAQYKEKMYPLEKMRKVVEKLAANNIVLLFGSASEAALLQNWEREIFSVFNIAGRYSLSEELNVISNLHLMISMDSANMHLASLYNIPVISVWGATHHFAGFYGWGQDEKNIAAINLYCRPCSVFGNKPCYRGDHACMQQLPEEMIIKKAEAIL